MLIKKFMSLVLVLVILSMSVLSFAQEKDQSQLDVYRINNEDEKMDFYLDGKNLFVYTSLGNNAYSIVEGNTFMRLKSLGDALNIKLYWNQNTREVSFDNNGKSVRLKIGSKTAYIGSEITKLDVAPFIKEGSTFIPLRFISETLGIKVNYIDVRPEGEFAKRAILKNYPSIKRIIDSGSFKRGSSYITPRLRVDTYEPSTHSMKILFEEFDRNWDYNNDTLDRFNVNIEDRTIYDHSQNKITVEWYEKENIQIEDTEDRYSNLGKERNIPYRVKDYIVNGQSHLSNAEAFWWDETHLEALTDETINDLYSKFLETGGNGDNIRDFAEYLSLNAPVYPKWKEVFEASFLPGWEGRRITRYEDYGDGVIGVYMDIEGRDTPVVYVDARTGYYRG